MEKAARDPKHQAAAAPRGFPRAPAALHGAARARA